MSHQERINTINSILPRVNDEHVRERLLRERRTLLRIVHNIPQQIQLPLDWQPENSLG